MISLKRVLGISLLDEIELGQKVDSILSIEEVPYIFGNDELKKERLGKIELLEREIEESGICYQSRVRMLQKIYGSRFVLQLRSGNDYLQMLAAGGLGFVLGYLANDGIGNYFKKVAGEVIDEFNRSKAASF